MKAPLLTFRNASYRKVSHLELTPDLVSPYFTSEKRSSDGTDNKEFNIAVRFRWMAMAVKPKKLSLLRGEILPQKFRGGKQGRVTFRPAISRVGTQSLMGYVLHIIVIPSAYQVFRVDREIREALE